MPGSKTETDLIATVANIPDSASCLLFAQRAKEAGMWELAAACEERAEFLRPRKSPPRRTTATVRKPLDAEMKSHVAAEQSLAILIEDYNAGLEPTTYGELAQRCGYGGQDNARWFGQVTDLIDAACALANVPSFALIRVREANGNVNAAAWRENEYSHLRDKIIRKAEAGAWSEQDFLNIREALAVFSAHGYGNKRAWRYVFSQIKMENWAG